MLHIVLEASALANLIFINGYALKRKDRELFILYWVCIVFAFAYETHGTGFQWNYPNYSLYILYGTVPFAILFGWSWWIVYFGKIANIVRIRLSLVKWYHPLVTDYLICTILGSIFESIAVTMGWWVYLNPKQPLIFNISFSVWLFWGIPPAILLHFSRWFEENLSSSSSTRPRGLSE